jgi:hypothetical protein
MGPAVLLLASLTLCLAMPQASTGPGVEYCIDLLDRIWHPAPNRIKQSASKSNTDTIGAIGCEDGGDWCSDPETYPNDKILSAVAKQADVVKKLLYQDAFEERMLGLQPFEDDDYEYIYEDELENLCEVSTGYIRPRAAKNKNGQFRFIVNHPGGGGEQYVQLVRVARCRGAGEVCSIGGETMCQQEFLDHKLVVLSEEGDELVIDTFTFPSCCTCLRRTALKKK